MINEEQLYDQIEKYLLGQMSPGERTAFQKAMDKDSELAAEVALHQNLAQAINEEPEIEDLKNKIGAVLLKGKTKAPASTAKRRFLSFPVSIAAAVALLAIITTVVIFFVNKPTNQIERLVAEKVAYPPVIYEEAGVRNIEKTQNGQNKLEVQLDSLWTLTNQDYEKDQYEAALMTLEAVAKLETELFQAPSSNYFYNKGILHMRTGQLTEALAAFEQVKTSYTENAGWYRAITLLLMPDRRSEALNAIDIIRKSGTPWADNAQELWEKLQ